MPVYCNLQAGDAERCAVQANKGCAQLSVTKKNNSQMIPVLPACTLTDDWRHTW